MDIKDFAPDILVDIRYATYDNFTKEILYPANRCLLRKHAVKALRKAQKKLRKKGLGLKVWDCYRPVSVQEKLWELVKDENYVANPKKGSRHNRGAAVDVTLVDSEGQELEMPTAYDDFSERAHRNFSGVSKQAAFNRMMLEDAMESFGFEGLLTEWWHFDFKNWKRYGLLNIALEVIPELLESAQLIVIETRDWDSFDGKLKIFERKNKSWKKITSWKVVLGKNGLAWGLGLHPDMSREPLKIEGDRRSPAGIFSMGRVYGYSPQPLSGMKLAYQQRGDDLGCVDVTTSPFYNRIVPDTSTVLGLLTEDGFLKAQTLSQGPEGVILSTGLIKVRSQLYWVWVMNHNVPAEGMELEREAEQDSNQLSVIGNQYSKFDNKNSPFDIPQQIANYRLPITDYRLHARPIAGRGSCAFLHVWRSKKNGTSACAAMEKRNLEYLLLWADPQKKPLLVILPKEEYKRYRYVWNLP